MVVDREVMDRVVRRGKDMRLWANVVFDGLGYYARYDLHLYLYLQKFESITTLSQTREVRHLMCGRRPCTRHPSSSVA